MSVGGRQERDGKDCASPVLPSDLVTGRHRLSVRWDRFCATVHRSEETVVYDGLSSVEMKRCFCAM